MPTLSWPPLQGHIVTNYHVIQNARAAQVTLASNRKFEATLRGYEGDKDLAVLKIDAPAEELVPIEVGVSSRLVVGQRVFAIGEHLEFLWCAVQPVSGTGHAGMCCTVWHRQSDW
jgi:S1-C subfamily serine protease